MNDIRELTWEDHEPFFQGVPVADCRVLSDEELDQVSGGSRMRNIVKLVKKGANALGWGSVGVEVGREIKETLEEGGEGGGGGGVGGGGGRVYDQLPPCVEDHRTL